MFLRFVENIDDNNYRSIRKWKSLDEISDNMIRAALAAEDANFMEHFGFDWEAIKRAMDLNRRGGKKYGASTITQQTAKNVYLTPSRSWFRKGMEAYFTILIEIFWTKERIIEIYLNVIEVGNGLYGVEAAAQTYFNKPAYKLTAFEACQIASILPNPREYQIDNPTRELQKKQRKIKQSMEYVKWKERKKER
jgi:monofunctional biosynthetic peptidoglycan transglycosylase